MKEKWNLTTGVFKLIWKYQPCYYITSVLKIVVTAALPLVGIWLPKGILECLATERDYIDIVIFIGLYAGLLIGLRLADNVLVYWSDLQMQQLKSRLQMEIGTAAMNAKMEEIENAFYKEEILMAGNISNVTSVISILQQMAACMITIAGIIYIIISFHILFLCLLLTTLTVKVVFTIIRFHTITQGRRKQAQNDKIGGYLDFVQYFSQGSQKEIRVNALYDWFFGKVKDFRNRMVSIQYVIMKQHQIFEMINRCILAVQNLIILIVLTKYYKEGIISIADFTMNFTAIGTLSVTLSKIADQIMEYNLQMLNCRNYNKIVNVTDKSGSDLRSEHSDDGKGMGELLAAELEFVNVTFGYPGTQINILKNVSLKVQAGEKIMLVGYNGEGKTTLIKLICKFYRPDAGKILLNGKDIWETSNEQYYKQIATVFQDFSLFPFTIKENILMSCEDEDIERSIFLSGFDAYVSRQKKKEYTHLTTLFDENGVELSGGEEQKLAISRAIQKKAALIMFDEPTASLDVKTENEIYKTFAEMTKGMTAIVISHRLSMANICDRIFVLDQGCIVESGTHKELIEKSGIYAEMYRKQSEAYK